MIFDLLDNKYLNHPFSCNKQYYKRRLRKVYGEKFIDVEKHRVRNS